MHWYVSSAVQCCNHVATQTKDLDLAMNDREGIIFTWTATRRGRDGGESEKKAPVGALAQEFLSKQVLGVQRAWGAQFGPCLN